MTSPATDFFQPRLARRRRKGRVFAAFCLLMTIVGVVFLGGLLTRIIGQGARWISVDFFRNFESILWPETAGIRSGLGGSLWLVGLTLLFAVPIGVSAAIFLEEFAPPSRIKKFIEVNIANLAGVPSIVYGMLGLVVFVRWSRLGASVLSGSLALTLLILPVVIIASREAMVAVPKSYRLAAYALGATRWQAVRSHVLPAALPGIITGVILALSRAIGETAPLILVGAVVSIEMVPSVPWDEGFTALPMQIYDWTSQPDPIFHQLAAAAIIVLLGVMIPMNAIAAVVRAMRQRNRLS